MAHQLGLDAQADAGESQAEVECASEPNACAELMRGPCFVIVVIGVVAVIVIVIIDISVELWPKRSSKG